MTIKRPTSRRSVPHEPDLKMVQRELASFLIPLDTPITMAYLDRWMRGHTIRGLVFKNTVWGTIRWKKSIGRPSTSAMASAFVVKHFFRQSILIYEDGAVRFKDFVLPQPDPSKSDGPEDAEYYRVSFIANTLQGENGITVARAENVGWDYGRGRLPGYIDIEPRSKGFVKNEQTYVLEPFDVVVKSYQVLAP